MTEPGELIRQARRESGLTQAELADRLETTQTAVARLERRGANPRMSTLRRALRATGHELALEVVAVNPAMDEAQLRAHLALTPSERAEAHDRAYENVAETVHAARRVG